MDMVLVNILKSTRIHSSLQDAKEKFQSLQQIYSVLSDPEKYDPPALNLSYGSSGFPVLWPMEHHRGQTTHNCISFAGLPALDSVEDYQNESL
jgi:hypothetical protein